MSKNKDTSIAIELARASARKAVQASTITDSARLLDSPERQAQVRIMREMGWNQGLSRAEAIMGSEKERGSLVAAFNHGDVAKIEEIRGIAVDYDLKFRPANEFKCPERHEETMASMISSFLISKSIEVNAWSPNNFYILADERHFKKQQNDIDDEVGAVLFYKPPKDDNNYLRVDQFGEGKLSSARYRRGWSRQNPKNFAIHCGVRSFVIALPLWTLAFLSFQSGVVAALVSAIAATSVAIYVFEKDGVFVREKWKTINR